MVDIGSARKDSFDAFILLVQSNDAMCLSWNFKSIEPLADNDLILWIVFVVVPDVSATEAQLVPVLDSAYIDLSKLSLEVFEAHPECTILFI